MTKESGFDGLQRRLEGMPDSPPLPQRLQRLSHLPWRTCYRQQLRTEGKSENTIKSYMCGINKFIETPLADEEAGPDMVPTVDAGLRHLSGPGPVQDRPGKHMIAASSRLLQKGSR